MAGNVWEWNQDLDKEGGANRVVCDGGLANETERRAVTFERVTF